MPNGGQFSSGSGIRLQATSPGVVDVGNENISGVILAGVHGSYSTLYPATVPSFQAFGTFSYPAAPLGYHAFSDTAIGGLIKLGALGGNTVIGTGADACGGLDYAVTSALNAVIIGNGAAWNGGYGTGQGSVAIGSGAAISEGEQVAIGHSANAGAMAGAIAIGASSAAHKTSNIVIGYGATDHSFTNIIRIGLTDTVDNNNQVRIGDSTQDKCVIGKWTLQTLSGNGHYYSINDANLVLNYNMCRIGTTALSAPRTIQLPKAADVAPGQSFLLTDTAGVVTAVNTLTILPDGVETICGQASLVLDVPYGSINIVSDGINKWSLLRPQLRRLEFLANGSWVCPPGVYAVQLLIAGGGGGGGGADNASKGAGCGGGGGQVVAGVYPVVPGTSYSITIGTAGTGATAGANIGGTGGSTSFGAIATALGGGGGDNGALALGTTNCSLCAPGGYGKGARVERIMYNARTTPGVSGFGEGGNTGYVAAASVGAAGGSAIGIGGAAGTTANTMPGGGGGGGSYGNGGAGGNGATGGNVGIAAAANTGGGGGGAGGGADKAGGAGGTGICIVSWLE